MGSENKAWREVECVDTSPALSLGDQTQLTHKKSHGGVLTLQEL